MRLMLGVAGFLLSSAAFGFDIAVEKDASLIQSSLCCGSGAADRNFGQAATVDAGRYHHQARALLGFSLENLGSFEGVQLILPGTTVGSTPAIFAVSLVTGAWDENTVTYNSVPASVLLDSAGQWTQGRLQFDVAEAVRTAVLEGRTSISFIVDAKGSSNLFIPSRENSSGAPTATLQTVP